MDVYGGGYWIGGKVLDVIGALGSVLGPIDRRLRPGLRAAFASGCFAADVACMVSEACDNSV